MGKNVKKCAPVKNFILNPCLSLKYQNASSASSDDHRTSTETARPLIVGKHFPAWILKRIESD